MHTKKRYTQVWGTLILLLIWLLVAFNAGSVFAAPNIPPGPDRYTAITVDYSTYTWWIMSWANSELICEVNIEHDGLPTLGDVYVDCGEGLYNAWVEQDACPDEIFYTNTNACPGYYLYLVTSTPKQKEVALALPAPVIWVELEGCSVEAATNRCELPPTLILRGDEPLSGEKIIRISGEINGETFSCNDAVCRIPLNETDEAGVEVSFWAHSSYGDSSHVFDAQVRVTYVEDEDIDHFWYVDILSSQWRGEANASCSESWDAFPPVGGVPYWLSTPSEISELETDFSYTYLAGNLITAKIVDASQCLDFGIDASGQATPCGLEVAQPAMVEWQNRFDSLIMQASEESNTPAILLKRLFARESQFWPGVFNEGKDIGFGHLTENGADMALLWNASFFEEFCPLVLEDGVCNGSYLNLSEEEQERIRGALVYSVNATCEECPLGLDLQQAEYSVGVFAHTLLGSCEQTGRVVHNNTDQTPSATTSYEDLWKFTLVDYNAGAGCLSLAIGETLGKNQILNWDNLSSNLTPVCMGAKDYVDDISRENSE